MKIFGHPVHMMLIHFPTALLPMDLVCSVLHYYTGNPSFGHAAFYALAGGVLLGWAAVTTGLLDLAKVATTHPRSLKKALLHGGLNSFVLLFYTLFAYSQYKQYPLLPAASFLTLIVRAVLMGCLVAGNYLGGSLILKDKVATDN